MLRLRKQEEMFRMCPPKKLFKNDYCLVCWLLSLVPIVAGTYQKLVPQISSRELYLILSENTGKLYATGNYTHPLCAIAPIYHKHTKKIPYMPFRGTQGKGYIFQWQ